MALLEVKNLDVRFKTRESELCAIRGLSFTLEKGERLGIVGESGAGKSVAAFSIINLISKPGYIHSGEILFNGQDLAKLSEKEIRKVRGNKICMIFQDPMMTLNPVLSIGTQMIECLQTHRGLSRAAAKQVALDRLKQVAIPSPEKRFDQYPHELSGGMRQRVVIAIALLTNPELIIADEPTTALDVTIQAEIMLLLLELCEQDQVGLILITHDLGVVSQVTQRAIVMYAGQVIEMGDTREIITNARHPYTHGLINALPQQTPAGKKLQQIPGNMPSLQSIPSGCAFNPRCEFADANCSEVVPPLHTVRETPIHEVACIHLDRTVAYEVPQNG